MEVKIKKILKKFFLLVVVFFPRFKSVRWKPYGLNLIGFLTAELGLGQSMRNLTTSVHAVSIPFATRDLSKYLLNRGLTDRPLKIGNNRNSYNVNVFCINPDLLYRIPTWLNPLDWAIGYNVGYWFWELPKYPEEWKYAISMVDEIWCSTDFIAESMVSTGKIVQKIPFAIDISHSIRNRSYYGLPENKFLYLFSYDFLSSTDRKNPDAVIDSFMIARERLGNRAALVIKCINSHARLEDYARLISRIKESEANIYIIDKSLTTDEMYGLISVCDTYVSLHRAEGLGLGLAEAMFLGKPVVATGYSGNMEFMNSSNSCIVEYDLVSVEDGSYLSNVGQFWAEPDIKHAAGFMHRLCEDYTYRVEIGEAARTYMRTYHNLDVCGRAVKARLEIIAAK